MAHVTSGVEYALHCLLHLVDGSEEGRVASTRDLAELQGVSTTYVAKLFTKLQRAGIVVAAEGAGGGFRLARPAAAIRVLDVVRAIDGEKSLFECREIRGRCAAFGERPPIWATRGVCSIHAVMIEAETRMLEVLASRTLADIDAAVAAKAPREFGRRIEDWLAARNANAYRPTTAARARRRIP